MLFLMSGNPVLIDIVPLEHLLFRRKNKNYLYPSFNTIAGYGSNGAIVHYRAKKENSKAINKTKKSKKNHWNHVESNEILQKSMRNQRKIYEIYKKILFCGGLSHSHTRAERDL